MVRDVFSETDGRGIRTPLSGNPEQSKGENGSFSQTDGRGRERDGEIKERGYDALGTEDEQYPSESRGDRSQRDSVRPLLEGAMRSVYEFKKPCLEVSFETSRKEVIMAEEKRKEILVSEQDTDKLYLVEDGDDTYYVDEDYLKYMNSLGLVR